MSPENIAKGKKAIEQDGCVVIEDAIDLAHIALLRERMLDDLPKILARKDAPFNFNVSNVQQDPPPFAPYLFQDIFANNFAVAVSQAVLGSGLYNAFYSGNTALPHSTQSQPTHADLGHLWPNMDHATPPYALVVNVPLVDMDAANGSTEIWPGTHLDTSVAWQDGDIRVTPERLEAQRMERAPIQPAVRAGSILIRDIRMWHGGKPNPSDQPRPMIAMIHWVSWWHHGDLQKFPVSSRPLMEHPILESRFEFVDGPVDYLHTGEAYAVESAT